MTRILAIAWTAVLVAVALAIALASWMQLLYATCLDVPIPCVDYPRPGTPFGPPLNNGGAQ